MQIECVGGVSATSDQQSSRLPRQHLQLVHDDNDGTDLDDLFDDVDIDDAAVHQQAAMDQLAGLWDVNLRVSSAAAGSRLIETAFHGRSQSKQHADSSMTVHRRRYLNPFVLFPPSAPIGTDTNLKRKGRRPEKKIDCSLTLRRNGTFRLVPAKSNRTDQETDDDGSSNRIPIHGRWTIAKNPYCHTDRFYDDICLHSFPRTLKQRLYTDPDRTGKRHDNNQDEEAKTIERVSFQFNCKLYGRTDSSPSREQFKVKHGTILWRDEHSERPKNICGWWKQRRVIGTFAGQPSRFR